jgi:ElaB/YqjD/DUF883 family membrane-anchored ribosome-binding protein
METNFEAIEKAQGARARDRLMTDLKTLSHDAEDLLKATAGDVSEKTKEARARLGAALEKVKSTCHDMQENAVASAKAAAKKADTVIRDHPYESIGVAFGVGLLLGVLAARK